MGSGTANWRNSIDGYGNYWSDWTMPDDDHDRMVDTPNELAGAAGTSGEYPRTTAVTPIPEFSSAGIANLAHGEQWHSSSPSGDVVSALGAEYQDND